MIMTMNNVGYKWDVFLSYRRWREWPRWVTGPFRELFEHWLGEELDWEPKVFIDQRDTEQGSWWDLDLAIQLGRSKIIVPLFSRKYFQSEWCTTELGLMRMREKECGFRTPKNEKKLIMPAIIHDGNEFPIEAKRFTGPKLPSHVWMAPNSPRFEELETQIQAWVPAVARAIKEAPSFNNTWIDKSVDNFAEVFWAKVGEVSNPRLG